MFLEMSARKSNFIFHLKKLDWNSVFNDWQCLIIQIQKQFKYDVKAKNLKSAKLKEIFCKYLL